MLVRAFLTALFVFSATGLWAQPDAAADGRSDARALITVQSTTSTENSGLLAYLFPLFTESTGYPVRTVAVGTGQAIKNASRGDGDVLLVHAKAAEEAFVAEGHGISRTDLMFNDFVVVGPAADPAGVKGAASATDALSQIAASDVLFISRGDDSGTHKKELGLWQAAGIDPKASLKNRYWESGSGMGATLNVAAGKGAYTLTDRATWIAFANKADLEIVAEGDPALFNQYGVIVVNPDRHPDVNVAGATALADWLLSPVGQAAIAAYRVDGQQLFFPNAPAR